MIPPSATWRGVLVLVLGVAGSVSATVPCPAPGYLESVPTGTIWQFDGVTDQVEITSASANFCASAVGWTVSGDFGSQTAGFTPAGCFGGGSTTCSFVLKVTDEPNFSFCIRWVDASGDNDCTYTSGDLPVELLSFAVD